MPKTEQLKEIEKAAKAQAELQEKMQAIQEERMEKIVLKAREILPLITEADKTLDKTKIMLETMAVTLQQGVYYLMRDNTVEALKLEEKIDKNFPDYEVYLPILALLKDVPLDLATESLQWLSEKIKAVQKEEDKKRNFKDLNLEF